MNAKAENLKEITQGSQEAPVKKKKVVRKAKSTNGMKTLGLRPTLEENDKLDLLMNEVSSYKPRKKPISHSAFFRAAIIYFAENPLAHQELAEIWCDQ